MLFLQFLTLLSYPTIITLALLTFVASDISLDRKIVVRTNLQLEQERERNYNDARILILAKLHGAQGRNYVLI